MRTNLSESFMKILRKGLISNEKIFNEINWNKFTGIELFVKKYWITFG